MLTLARTQRLSLLELLLRALDCYVRKNKRHSRSSIGRLRRKNKK
jgi:hypothetical protein